MQILRRLLPLACAVVLLQTPLLQARELRIETIKSDPFGYDDSRGKGGMMYEIGNLIAETAGLPYQNNIVPYARTVVSLRSGTADMVLRFSNEELASVAYQVAPVLAMPTMIIGRAENNQRKLEDLRGSTVATSRSFPVDRRVAAEPAIHIYFTDSNEHSVRMLFAGRVDAILGSDLGIYGAAQALNRKVGDFSQPIPLEPQNFWLHFSRKTADPATMAALKKAVEKLQRQGAIERIWKKYLSKAMPPLSQAPALLPISASAPARQ